MLTLPGMEATAYKIEVGGRLRTAFEALGLRQADVAREFQVDKTKLNHWLQGMHYPDPLFVKRFCARYRVTADYIYLGEVSAVPKSLADSLLLAEQG